MTESTDTTGTPDDEAAPSPRRSLPVRIGRAAGWTLVWLGVLTLGFVAHQLWITSWFAQQNQQELAQERVAQWAETSITEVAVQPADTGDPNDDPNGDGGDTSPPVYLKVESAPELHAAFALIRIPSIERLADGWNVVEGVTRADLKTGTGHMPDTALPGQPGNAVISGHRTTYGQPFHELDQLQPGDLIEVETALGTHVYAVRETLVVAPTELSVTEPKPGAWLTLTTCHPKFSARQRLVVVAELVAGPNFEAIQEMS
jgi:sortase A